MDVIFKINNGTESLQQTEVQKKLEKEKLNKPDETVYNAIESPEVEKIGTNHKVLNNKTRSKDGKEKAGEAEKSKRVDDFLKNKLVFFDGVFKDGEMIVSSKGDTEEQQKKEQDFGKLNRNNKTELHLHEEG